MKAKIKTKNKSVNSKAKATIKAKSKSVVKTSAKAKVKDKVRVAPKTVVKPSVKSKARAKAKVAKKRIRNTVRVSVIPSEKNQYQPHLIRGYGITAIIFIVIGMQMGYNTALTGRVLGTKTTITTADLLRETNETRSSFKLGTLKSNEKLNQAAYLKAQDMMANQYWAHVSPNGTQPWKWFGDVNYNYAEAGENLAKNFSTTGATMTAWMNSPGHKDNVLNPDYLEAGFAVIDGDLDGQPTTLVVALYGRPAESAVVGAKAVFSQPGAAVDGNVLTRFAIASQSITAVAIVGIALTTFATFVASLSHAYRQKLPKKMRKSWHRQHGLIKAIGLSIFSLAIIFFYSRGQI